MAEGRTHEQNGAEKGATSAVGHASAAKAPNIVAIYTASMSAPGEQVARSALILENPSFTHNVIIHELAVS